MGAAAAILSAAVAIWLSNGFHRLLYDVDWLSAYDVKLRHEEVACWFAGMPVYEEMRDAIYPPASYAELWPLLGWLDLEPARRLWAAACAGALVWLALLCGRQVAPDASTGVRVVAALVPAALWSTGHSIGQGQLGVLVLPAVLTAARWAVDEGGGNEIAAALLVLFALVKPTLTAPFFWIFLFFRRRVAAAAILGYLLLTLLAMSYQDAPVAAVLRGWLRRGLHVAALQGDSDLATALAAGGWQRWILPMTLAVLALHGMWTWRHRRADPWVLLGMSGIVARLWTYHYPYDDILLLVPTLALARRAAGPARDRLAGGLAVVAVAVLVLPPVPGGAALLSAPLAAWLAVVARRQVQRAGAL